MDWANAIQEVIDSHADQKEIAGKLKNFCEGLDDLGNPITEVTFNFADSSTKTIDCLPTIAAKAAGAVSHTAIENITSGSPVKLVNDGGTYKAKNMKVASFESAAIATALASASKSFCWIDNLTLRGVVVYTDPGTYAMKAKVVKVSAAGAITYGAEATLLATPTTTEPTIYYSFCATEDALDGVFGVIYTDADSTPANQLFALICKTDGDTITDIGTPIAIHTTAVSDCQGIYCKTTGVLNLSFVDATKIKYVNSNVIDGATLNITFHSKQDTFTISTSIFSQRICLDENSKTAIVLFSECTTPNYKTYLCTYKDYDTASPTKIDGATRGELYATTTNTVLILDIAFDTATNTLLAVTSLSSVSAIYALWIKFDDTKNIEISRQLLYYTSLFSAYYARFDIQNKQLALMIGFSATLIIDYKINPAFLTVIAMGQYALSPAGLYLTTGIENKRIHVMTSTNVECACQFIDERDDLYGIANSTATLPATPTLNISTISGLCTSLSGLIPGKKYYLQADLTVTDIISDYFVGIAIATDELKM